MKLWCQKWRLFLKKTYDPSWILLGDSLHILAILFQPERIPWSTSSLIKWSSGFFHGHLFYNAWRGQLQYIWWNLITTTNDRFVRVHRIPHFENSIRTRFPFGCAYLSNYPGYFRESHWNSMGLLEISRVTLTGMIVVCCDYVQNYRTNFFHDYLTHFEAEWRIYASVI